MRLLSRRALVKSSALWALAAWPAALWSQQRAVQGSRIPGVQDDPGTRINTTAVADFLDEVRQSRAFTMECAQAMPENKYGFRPAQDIRSFGQQMVHIAEAVPGLFELFIEGKTPPEHTFSEAGQEKFASKADVLAQLNGGFGYVERAGLTLRNEALETTVKWFDGRIMTKRRMLRLILDHATHHRAQSIVYLRLSGFRPPPYRA